MTDTLFTQHVKARDLKPGMSIIASEHWGETRKIRNVLVHEFGVIVDYTTEMSGRTFRLDDVVEVA